MSEQKPTFNLDSGEIPFDLFAPGSPVPEGTISEEGEVVETAPKEEAAEAVEAPAVDPGYQTSKKLLLLDKQMKAFESQKAEVEAAKAEIAEFQRFKMEARKNPMKALEALGIDQDYYNDWLLNGGEQPEADKYAELEQKFNQKLQALEEEKSKQEQSAYNQRVEAYKQGLFEKIQAFGEGAELINTLGQQEEVYNLMDLWYQQNNEVLPEVEAIRLVEEELYKREVEKLTRSTKLQNAIKGSPKKEVKEPEQPAKPAHTPTKSISGLSASSSPPTKKARMSDDEAIEHLTRNYNIFK